MADIQINELLESTTAANSDWIAIDNGTATKKISVQNFNSTGAASAAQSAAAAAQSATDAAASKTAAEQAEADTQALITSAQTIVSDAQTYANEAATSAGTASTAVNTATAQAAIATNQANLAAGYAQNVDNFAKNAKSWAVGGTGTRQGEDTDNSKYYSQQAHDSEINAAASESAAATSEANAAASETAAATSESNAATSESNAATSETNAATSESNAATSASNAASSESNAATSETNAAASATAAGESEDDSEAWAWGKVNGVDVPSSHPAYHNNAKYWADNAAGAAGGGVTSFNGRNGIVVPDSTDYDAGMIPYDNTNSGLTATTTQNAIDEVQYNIDTLNGSLKPVAKSGVYNDLTEKPTLGTAAAKNATNTIAEDSTDLIQSGAVYDALELKANAVDLGTAAAKASTNAVTEDSTDLVESGAVFSELATRDAEIADMNNILGAKNLLPKDHYKAVSNSVGVTTTINADGSISLSGQFTAQASVLLCDSWTVKEVGWIKKLEGKNVKFSGNVANLNVVLRLTTSGGNNDKGTGYDVDGENEFTMPTGVLSYTLYIYPNSSTLNVSGLTIRPMLRLASIQDDTYEPYSMTNREITPYVQAISNPNLLDNPWFTINQRGKSTYNTTGVYTVDRWRFDHFNGDSPTTKSITVSDNGITCTHDSTGAECIQQLIENTIFKRFKQGDKYTLSCEVSGNGVVIGYVWDGSNWHNIFPNETTLTSASHQVLTTTFDMWNTSNTTQFKVVFTFRNSPNVTFHAIKLEKGTVSTLAMDTAPNYATELLKCQRYFFKSGNDGNGRTDCFIEGVTTGATTGFRFPVEMRAVPIVTVNSIKKVENLSAVSLTGITTGILKQGIMYFLDSNNGFVVDTNYFADFQASADL